MRIEKEIIAYLAGIIAELKFWHTKDEYINSCIMGGSDDDLKRAYDLVFLLSPDGSFNEAKYSKCWKRARRMVNSKWPVIETVAKELSANGVMGRSEIINIIKSQSREERR